MELPTILYIILMQGLHFSVSFSTAERGPEPLVLNACNPSSTSVTVISDIPGIEFPNPMVDCSDSRVTVSGGSITVRCDQFPAGQTTIQCMTSTGKDIKFVVFASISPSGKCQSLQSLVEFCLLVVWLCP